MEAHNSIMEIHKSSMEIHNELWRSMIINHRAPWLCFSLLTLAPRRSIAFRNSTGTWSRAPGKQFRVLDRWRDRHTRPARWSDTLRIRSVRWRKWNRIRIDLARLADPIKIAHQQALRASKPADGSSAAGVPPNKISTTYIKIYMCNSKLYGTSS